MSVTLVPDPLFTTELDVGGVHRRDLVALGQFRMALGVHQLIGDQWRRIGVFLVERFGGRIAAALDETIELDRLLESLDDLRSIAATG